MGDLLDLFKVLVGLPRPQRRRRGRPQALRAEDGWPERVHHRRLRPPPGQRRRPPPSPAAGGRLHALHPPDGHLPRGSRQHPRHPPLCRRRRRQVPGRLGPTSRKVYREFRPHLVIYRGRGGPLRKGPARRIGGRRRRDPRNATSSSSRTPRRIGVSVAVVLAGGCAPWTSRTPWTSTWTPVR